MKTIIFSFAFMLLLSSCAVHSGMITGNASLNDANFQIIGLGVGQAKTTQVFGLGGLKKDALTLEAKRNLYENHPLQPGQALANVTVDFKRSCFPIVTKTQAIVSAEIVDFNQTNMNNLEVNYDKIIDETKSDDWVVLLVNNNSYKAKILDKNDQKSVVLFENEKGNYKIKKVVNGSLYYPKDYSSEFKINDEVLFYKGNTKQIGKIIASNSKGSIIEYYEINAKKAFIQCSYKKMMKN
ncbi:DUF6567 family protein [Carboxylicivirga caseinilyticus]|uniref:DUF6567 family protein n=1 Tax=Carboxylicivirga caseinilyticus TaxID=3417572 RepID=UPI003D358A4C|nr:hypothetical protein [Marinilabiliaceae bacterium A049]